MYNPDEECNKLIAVIKHVYDMNGLSQHELAKKADISASTLNYLILGRSKPNIYTLFKLCNALDITIEELLSCGVNREINEDEIKILLKYRNLPDYKKEQVHIFMDLIKQYKNEE